MPGFVHISLLRGEETDPETAAASVTAVTSEIEAQGEALLDLEHTGLGSGRKHLLGLACLLKAEWPSVQGVISAVSEGKARWE